MKFAVVGCQHVHIKLFVNEMLELGHEFVGIVDDSEFSLPQKLAAEYEVPLYRSLDEIADMDLQMLGCASINIDKMDVVEWAEQRGIHVMVDKPVAVDEDTLGRLKRVMERSNIEVGMMLTARFNPMQYTLKKLIEQRVLGDIYDFTFLKPHKLDAANRPPWFFDLRQNGGLIIDLMIHDVDMLHWFTGKRIVGYQGLLAKHSLPQHPSFYDNAQMNLILEDHITATLKTDWLMPEKFDLWGDGRIFATGEKARVEIRLAGDVLSEPGPYLAIATHEKRTEKVDLQRPPCGLAEDFIRRIEKKPHRLTAADIYNSNAEVIKLDRSCVRIVAPKIAH